MYGIKQSTTMLYYPCRNPQCERFNGMLKYLLRSLSTELIQNWSLHLSAFVSTYNAMPHGITVFQPCEDMFGHKASTVCNAWLGLANYNDQYLPNKCTWVNQHDLILYANRHAIKLFKYCQV